MQIKTIWARNLNKTDWARIEGVHYTDNLDELLNDPEIDVVVITLPHHLHYDYIKKVLNAGKNCVCEKPFTETKEQAEDRAYRIGTKSSVNIITLIAKDTIDEKIHDLVYKKGKMSDIIVDKEIDAVTNEKMVQYLLS
jgi:hypothetical protein